MIDDIRSNSNKPKPASQQVVQVATPKELLLPKPAKQPLTLKAPRKRRWPLITTASVLVAILLTAVGCYWWWQVSLQPVDSHSTVAQRIVIPSGKGPNQIANELKQAGVIRSAFVFSWYVKLHGVANNLQAGTYSIAKNESLSQIVQQMTEGKTDYIKVTFLPGATISQDEAVLEQLGFSKSSVEAAFAKKYNDPLFATAPVSADLEGYIYGETYDFNAGVTPEQILEKTFSEYDMVIQNDNLVKSFKAQGLTLYQGITLASIIQREVNTPSDMHQVAQVFLLRLRNNIPLGSDVTYEYAAKKLGVTPTPTLDSPYNTRIHTGLPPGPIATPGQQALEAVANPANGNYLYFLSGDNGKTYFATTLTQHEENIKNYCKIKCSGQ